MSLRTRLLKIELLRAGLSQRDIAAAAAVEPSLVSHVVAGRRATGPDARRVRAVIAEKLGAEVDDLFPSVATVAA